MAFSKAHLFDKTLYLQSIWAKAHAHPARITIMTHLLDHGITPFSHLKKLINLSPPTTSQHIRFLVMKGILNVQEKYPHTYYELNTKTFTELSSMIRKLKTGFDPEDQNLFDESSMPTVSSTRGSAED